MYLSLVYISLLFLIALWITFEFLFRHEMSEVFRIFFKSKYIEIY